MSSEKKAFHIQLSPEDVEGIELVLLPGDPQRVPKICNYLTKVRPLAHHREYNSMRGEKDGRRILVISTGIGGPSTAIAIEELAMLGLRRFIRIGTSGAIQPGIDPGDLVISSGAVRLDGTSRHIAPVEYPAVADYQLVTALMASCRQHKATFHHGITATSDTFYQGQNRQDSFKKGFLIRDLQGQLEELQHLNVLSYEMEAATLLTQTNAYGLQGACILGILVNRTQKERPDESKIAAAEEQVIRVAVDAVSHLN